MDRNTPSRGSLPIARQKMFMASLAFSVGIIFAAAAPQYRPPLWVLIAAIAFATGAFFLRSLPNVHPTPPLRASAPPASRGRPPRETYARRGAPPRAGAAVDL